MSTANVEGQPSAGTGATAGPPARAAAGIVAGALVVLIAVRSGFRAVTVKIGS